MIIFYPSTTKIRTISDKKRQIVTNGDNTFDTSPLKPRMHLIRFPSDLEIQ